MKAFIALTVIGLASVAYLGLFSEDTTLNSEFQNFIQTHKVSYANSAEYEFRQKAFEKNLEKIARLNKANPLATFGINKFADRTEEELESMLTKRSSDDNGSCKAYTPEGSPQIISWVTSWELTRTKVNVEPAGALHPHLLLKEDMLSPKELQIRSLQDLLNSNFLTVTASHKWDVTEELKLVYSSSTRRTTSAFKIDMSTKLRKENANNAALESELLLAPIWLK
uniref:Cathepsin propeptide inhibitor domain-containing protein n=1 Tax=Euplotes crassus TaxID=5936 RepID=A0A7S3KWD2_EUPCR|mmetsp:Transcript_9157/g.8769  ORF Transcript_9157/g.8769 Transcript_9157/m.8769 type:complete len:225 (+) Transcript_9157:22-696(+)